MIHHTYNIITRSQYTFESIKENRTIKRHKSRVLTPEQVMQQISNAYKFLNL